MYLVYRYLYFLDSNFRSLGIRNLPAALLYFRNSQFCNFAHYPYFRVIFIGVQYENYAERLVTLQTSNRSAVNRSTNQNGTHQNPCPTATITATTTTTTSTTTTPATTTNHQPPVPATLTTTQHLSLSCDFHSFLRPIHLAQHICTTSGRTRRSIFLRCLDKATSTHVLENIELRSKRASKVRELCVRKGLSALRE